jgi:hypothetical protein
MIPEDIALFNCMLQEPLGGAMAIIEHWPYTEEGRSMAIGYLDQAFNWGEAL